jgi:hypothetical protein
VSGVGPTGGGGSPVVGYLVNRVEQRVHQFLMTLVMQADVSFWDSLAFDGINDVDVEAVIAAFGTVDVVARGRAAEAARPDFGMPSRRPR